MNIIEAIRRDDPSFDPLANALAESGVSRAEYETATSRVYWDGYYGPISDADWNEHDGRPMTMQQAHDIIGKVAEAVGDYHEMTLELCDDEDCETCREECGHEVDVSTVAARDIRRELFAPFVAIYGADPTAY